jgi:hypothetical protein
MNNGGVRVRAYICSMLPGIDRHRVSRSERQQTASNCVGRSSYASFPVGRPDAPLLPAARASRENHELPIVSACQQGLLLLLESRRRGAASQVNPARPLITPQRPTTVPFPRPARRWSTRHCRRAGFARVRHAGMACLSPCWTTSVYVLRTHVWIYMHSEYSYSQLVRTDRSFSDVKLQAGTSPVQFQKQPRLCLWFSENLWGVSLVLHIYVLYSRINTAMLDDNTLRHTNQVDASNNNQRTCLCPSACNTTGTDIFVFWFFRTGT